MWVGGGGGGGKINEDWAYVELKGAQLCIHEREMGSNQAFQPKGQENWFREDLSKNKPSSRIPIKSTRGRFEPRAWAEEEDRLKKIGK